MPRQEFKMTNNTIKVETGAGPVLVKKLALYDYAEFFRALKKLPAEIGKMGQIDKDNALAVLPEVLAESYGDFIAVLAVVTDKDEEFFKSPDIDLADALEIVEAGLRLNDYNKIVSSVKKIMAQRQVPNALKSQPKADQ